jgi:UDP-N-acetylmuramoyl-L-alanyl-D-glutamate--2,6-diaminopimelate ligase
VCDDSRRVVHGALFVAVTGTQACGATYAGEAAYRGAAAIVAETDVAVDRSWTPEARAGAGGPVVVKVPDARHALARLAAAHFGLDRIQDDGELAVTGVTGTNGKTTVAYMLRSILRAAGRPVAMLGTIEYDLVKRRMPADLTTPGPIALTRYLTEAHAAGGRYVVMEASSHSLDQRRTEGIRFSTAIFTNLTQDHLDYHRTEEEYLRSKQRLFDVLGPDAVAVVNADEPASERMVENCKARVMTFGLTGPADVRGQVAGPNEPGAGASTRFVLDYQGQRMEISTQLVGRHNILNALAAAAGGLAMGLDIGAIERGLAGLAHVPGRLQRVSTGDLGFEVYVDYAHTEDALRNVLRAVRPLARGRLWCVFGCGGDRDRTKRPLMARAVAEGADAFIITSDNPRTEDPLAIIGDIERGLSGKDRSRAMTVPDRARAIDRAIDLLSPGDVLVIAGKGHEDYQILGSERVHFDDVEVAGAAIAQRQAGVECKL